MMCSEPTIRNAEARDVGQILEFIQALARYEKMGDQVVATEEGLRETMFAGATPWC